MAFADDILIILSGYSVGYKRMRQAIYGTSNFNALKSGKISNNTLYLTLSRLKKLGLVEKKDKNWIITNKGKKYSREKLSRSFPKHAKKEKTDQKKKIVIVFDIPEKHRRKRDWLRVELMLLGFSPIQKSVWLGPAPLPKEFIENLNTMKILENLKFFKVKEKDVV